MDYSDFLKMKDRLCGDSNFDWVEISTFETLKVTIDYNEAFSQMSKHLKKVDSEIEALFPLMGKCKQTVELKIIRLKNKQMKHLWTFWAIQAMYAHNMMPGKIEHLLAFSRAFPEHPIWESASRRFDVRISALGSYSLNFSLGVNCPILTEDFEFNRSLETRNAGAWCKVDPCEYFIVKTFSK